MIGRPARVRRETLAAIGLFLVAAAYFVLVELHRPGLPAFDVYIYFIPNKLHAAFSLWNGGKGLLWNPFQSCGEPYFGNPSMGMLYPLNLFFFVLDANVAVHVVLILNMVIGATGMLRLLRELGLGWAAAIGGALAYELGDPMAQLTGWSPMHNGPWTWMPWALLLSERLLRAPTSLRVAALAVVVALEVAPGWVLITVLTAQLIGLRVAWELLTNRRAHHWRSVAAIGGGIVLGLLLVAVQLVPAAELARESFRVAVESLEFAKFGSFEHTAISGLQYRMPPVPFTVALIVLAAIAPFVGSQRRLVVFYLIVGTLYAVLALGTATPLFRLYAMIPPGASTIKYPIRLWWITAFSLIMLASFSLDGLSRTAIPQPLRWLAVAVALVIAAALAVFAPGGLRWSEATAVVVLVGAVIGVAARPALGQSLAWVMVGCLVLNVAAVPLRYAGRLLPSADNLRRYATTFAALDPPITDQDRIFVIASGAAVNNLSLVQKTGTVLRIAELHDYEPLLGRRFWEYAGAMWPGAGPVTVYEDFDRAVAANAQFNRRLLDLASIRYVVTSAGYDLAQKGLQLPAASADGATFYRNDAALPRARYVPRVEVMRDPAALLERLGSGTDDLTAVALVEEDPSGGFLGSDAAAAAAMVRFVTNDPEHLAIDVDAPAPGFLVLADQFFPGWKATVNGAEVPIQRANYTFRLVQVPAGASRVEFRYRPVSVLLGAVVSAVALAILAILIWAGRQNAFTRRHGDTESMPSGSSPRLRASV